MLNKEVLWNKALTGNNVRGITHWLHSLTIEGQCDADKSLAKFNSWLQCSIELTKTDLLTVCFGKCHGMWMVLDQTSFIKLGLLTQKLKNLLLLARLEHTRLMCQINAKAMAQSGCWNLNLHTLRQHILLARLVQWWSFSGLLPHYPDVNELKQISQMWQEMNQHHKSLELRCDIEDRHRESSVLQGMVAYLQKQYGPLWVSEDCTYQTYPPPSLQSLLKLVLVPYTDTISALGIILYFILDVSDIQCKRGLPESFCQTFSIPANVFQQIYGLWLLDHGFIFILPGKLLCSETSSGWLSCHSYAVLRMLLRQGQKRSAQKHLYYSRPVIETIQDAGLLQNNHVAEAQILLRWCQPGNHYILEHFISDCENLNPCGEILASDIPCLKLSKRPNSSKPNRMKQRNLGDVVAGNKFVVKGHGPSPLSALLYQCLFNGSLTSADFLRLFRETVREINSSTKIARMMVVQPKYVENTKENRINTQSLDTSCQKEPLELELFHSDRMAHYAHEVHVSPADVSTFPQSIESVCSFSCSPSPPAAERRQEETSDKQRDSLYSCMPDKAVTQYCSDFTLSVREAPEAMLVKNSSRESVEDLFISEDEGVDNILTGAISENLVDPAESHMVDVTQTENSKEQTALYSAAIPVYCDDFFIPDFEKMTDDMVQELHFESISADEIEQFSVLSSESVYCQDSNCDEASASSSFLNLKPLRRVLPYPPVKKSLRSFSHDPQNAMDQPEILTSCAITESMQDILKQLHEQNLTLKDGEPLQPSSLASVRSSILVMDFNSVRRGSRPHQVHNSLGASLLPLSPTEKTKDKAVSEGKNAGVKEVVCFRTTSDRVGDCKLGSWWKQALETRRASTGLLPAIEQIPAISKEKRHSLVLGWPQSHGLIRGCKQEVKQASKEESSIRKAEGKRGKRVKQS